MSNIWDQKSNNYARFDGQLTPFGKRIFKVLDDFGVNFSAKSVIDIGCGTGVYTLYIAKFAREILGVDGSAGMLEVLNGDAQKFEIENVSTQQSYWLEFQAQKHYDIAICTMSPAIREDEDFEKFYALADCRVYLNFAKSRSSSMLEPFFKHYGVTSQNSSGTKNLQTWLESQNIEYKKANFSEKRVSVRNRKQALENVFWHLDINKTNYQESEVEAMFDEIYFGGEIKDVIHSHMSLFVF